MVSFISGGQTGADRAALDVALKFNLPHGGWLPRGRKTESGPLPGIYHLKEMATGDYPARTRQNILDSQGTVIFSHGPLTGGSRLTKVLAQDLGKPHCHLDLTYMDRFEAALHVHAFIWENNLECLNVAGPRASHDPGIYEAVRAVLETVLYLLFLNSSQEAGFKALLPPEPWHAGSPGNQKDAITLLDRYLPLKCRIFIARLAPSRISGLYFAWLDYVKARTGIDGPDSALMAHLTKEREPFCFTVEDGVMEIIKSLKADFETDYVLRIVK
jgi:hypothetical protein